MDRSMLNGSGCLDSVAHEAINNVEREKKRASAVHSRDAAAEVLVKNIKDMMWLSGFKLIGRVQFEDPKSGKKYL